MKAWSWWQPGRDGGLVSRQWVQVVVVPLPKLGRTELESSLRYRVQTLLPSPDQVVHLRFYPHQNRVLGVAIIDRLPAERPPTSKLRVGVPFLIPRHWPANAVVAIRSPEGWELHRYEDEILRQSFPPASADSPLVASFLEGYRDGPVLACFPDPLLQESVPQWATPAPREGASVPWGFPWAPPRTTTADWVGSAVLAGAAVAILGSTLWIAIDHRESRNRLWQQWLTEAQKRSIAASPVASAAQVRQRVGEPLLEILTELGEAWPAGVELRKVEVSRGKVLVSGATVSALAAVERLQKRASDRHYRVVQIRLIAGREEFDLEGTTQP